MATEPAPIPDGVKTYPRCGEVADAVGITVEQVKYQTRVGRLPRAQHDKEPGAWNYYRITDVVAFAESCGLEVNWEALL